MESIAFLLNGSERELFLCEVGGKKINLQTLISDQSVRKLFEEVGRQVLVEEGGRMDFLGCYAANHVDGGLITMELQGIMKKTVGIHRDLKGVEVTLPSGEKELLGSQYFNLEILASIESSLLKVSKDKDQKLKSYEKIRMVGKGAFGAAVLYRKKEDGLLVIIKEINMLDLAASERQMALNEVKVLATMDHPNIVSYFDSFEKDGVLMIEMEYADGGNLADLLIKRTTRMEEKEILEMFSQMVSSIRYMHDNGVLHRDLKTANIFLTKENMVKVGDFGISKMLTTRQGGAHTVLGTPYYISPEMCEGKVYDEKSDIWALGCIIYEMACLQKTFEGSNLPALVNKIMKGQFAPIRGNYTPLFKQLVRDLLQRDPEFRPAASEILLGKLPALMVQFESKYYDELDEMEEEIMAKLGPKSAKSGRPIRSVLYYLKAFESSISLVPVQLPPRSKIEQVAVSNTHICVLTAEGLVFTWGEGMKGQLGHGDLETWRSKPQCVESLKGKAITHVAVGDGFSVFTSDNGIVMTCGDGSFGCLGHGDWNSSSRPKLIEQLLSVDVVAVACGSEHVVVVGGQGDVYSWGRGAGGRLGLGTEEDVCVPREVCINSEEVYVTNVKCGGDGTIFITHEGFLYACGNNRSNKIGLNEQKGWFFSGHVEGALIPTRVKAVKSKIIDLSMGPGHTICLTENGQMITFGRNSEGQLGRGHTRASPMPGSVKEMNERIGALVEAGSTFTLVGTVDNVVHFWGTRNISPITRPSTQDAFSANFGTRKSSLADAEEEMEYAMMKRAHMGQASAGSRGTVPTLSTSALVRHQEEITMKDVVLEPQEILALYSSEVQINRGHNVTLGSIHCQNQNIFLVVETTCPVKRGNPPEVKPEEEQIVVDMNDHLDDEDVMDVGMEQSKGMEKSEVPEWLKAELEEAKSADRNKKNRRGHRSKKRSKEKRKRSGQSSKHKEEPEHPNFVATTEKEEVDEKTSSTQQQQMKRMEKEYSRKQQEIMMEAELAVKAREEALNNELARLREELDKQRAMQSQLLQQRAAKLGEEDLKGNRDESFCVVQ